MIKEILNNLDESIKNPQPPRGYKGFNSTKHLAELRKFLLSLVYTTGDKAGEKLFTERDVRYPKRNAQILLRKMAKEKIRRETLIYVRYVFDYGLTKDKEKINKFGIPTKYGYPPFL